MSLFSKFLAGGLGFVIAGPIGAIIGVVLDTIFTSQNKAVQTRQRNTSTRATATQADFRMSLLVLIAAVMRADDRIQKSELNVVKAFLVQTFGEESALEGLQILKKLLNQNIDIEPIAVQIGYSLTTSSKLQLIHMLYQVANGDGTIVPAEAQLIERIAQLMRIPISDFRSIQAMFTVHANANWAYEVMEITSDATDDEVKKAYRRMAMKYHPDKVNNMGEDVKRAATEKFRKVNEAYEQIKKERGMN